MFIILITIFRSPFFVIMEKIKNLNISRVQSHGEWGRSARGRLVSRTTHSTVAGALYRSRPDSRVASPDRPIRARAARHPRRNGYSVGAYATRMRAYMNSVGQTRRVQLGFTRSAIIGLCKHERGIQRIHKPSGTRAYSIPPCTALPASPRPVVPSFDMVRSLRIPLLWIVSPLRIPRV